MRPNLTQSGNLEETNNPKGSPNNTRVKKKKKQKQDLPGKVKKKQRRLKKIPIGIENDCRNNSYQQGGKGETIS